MPITSFVARQHDLRRWLGAFNDAGADQEAFESGRWEEAAGKRPSPRWHLARRPTSPPCTPQHAHLNQTRALRFRDCFGYSDPVWSLIGFFAHGRLLAPRGRSAAEIRVPPGPAMPGATVTMPTKPWATHAKPPSHRRPSRQPADQTADTDLHIRLSRRRSATANTSGAHARVNSH